VADHKRQFLDFVEELILGAEEKKGEIHFFYMRNLTFVPASR